MSADALIERLAVAGVTLTAIDTDHLAATPAELLTDELRGLIRTNKPALLALLRSESERRTHPLPAELERLIRHVATHHNFTSEELQETLTTAAGDVENALVSFRLLAAEIKAIDRETFEERAAIREYDGGYSRDDAELLAAWEVTQAVFARLTPREWLARYAPHRLPEGDKPENYPIAQVKPGYDFCAIREERTVRRTRWTLQ